MILVLLHQTAAHNTKYNKRRAVCQRQLSFLCIQVLTTLAASRAQSLFRQKIKVKGADS